MKIKTMEHAGYKAQIMEAPLLKGEGSHGLPPGEPLTVYPLACIPGAPEGWVREAGSYVIPVNTGKGLWFNWTMNDVLNTAVVPSVKGMNPITGQKLESLQLEQYADKCPIHKTAFAHGRHCQECGFEWPPQGYVTHESTLWWDGFRQPDGTVRQFYFTDEDKKDIASLVIGAENTVPAFGFAFYKPKVSRTPPPKITRGYSGMTMKSCSPMYSKKIGSCGSPKAGSAAPQVYASSSIGITKSSFVVPDSFEFSMSDELMAAPMADCCAAEEAVYSSQVGAHGPSEAELRARPRSMKSKSVGVAAGAKINQQLKQDALGVEGWQSEPSAIIRLYFAFSEQFEEMVQKGGIVELKNEPAGFMKGLPVGI
jgi:hypothetical protein